jgi:hypothetical protein
MSSRARLTPALTLAALALAAPAAASGPTFDVPKVLGVGSGVSDPRSVVAVDLDEDGRLDLVVGDRNGDNGRVTVLRNTGSAGALSFGAPLGGPFDPGVAGAGVGPVAAGDFNADGHPDVIAGLATGSVTDEVVVLTGDGDGALAAQAAGPIITRSNITGVAVADLDADGDLDALTSHEVGLTASQLAVLRQTGAGLTFVSSSGGGTTSMAMDVAAGQLDGTSGTDALVVSRNAGAGSAWVATGTGASFAALIPVAVGPRPEFVRLVDVDADGDLDGLVLDGSTGLISVLLNDGDAGLTASSVLVPGLGDGSGLAAADMDGDGDADLVVSDQTADRVGVLLGDGHGGFGAVSWLTMGSGARSALVADVTGDGVPDIVTADSGAAALSVRRGTSTPSPQAAGAASFGTRAVGSTGPPRTVTITNSGTARLAVMSVATAGAQGDDFLVTQDNCSGHSVLSGGADSCTVNLRFAPSDAGARTGVLALRLAGGGLYDVPLDGTGAADPEPAPTTDSAPASAPAPASTAEPDDGDDAPARAVDAPKAALPITLPISIEPATIQPLLLTLSRDKLSARAGAKLKVGFALGRAAKLVLRVKRGGRTVEILRASAKQGTGTITWDGRLGAKRAPAGTYRLAAYAVAADGATARASATVSIRR